MVASKLQDRPNCYDCRHRVNAPGSAHSRCKHPSVEKLVTKEMELIALLRGQPEGLQSVCEELKIMANYHGVKNGWFRWPLNFDPTWLEQCVGFEEATDDE